MGSILHFHDNFGSFCASEQCGGWKGGCLSDRGSESGDSLFDFHGGAVRIRKNRDQILVDSGVYPGNLQEDQGLPEGTEVQEDMILYEIIL